jgi:hypothetical protein
VAVGTAIPAAARMVRSTRVSSQVRGMHSAYRALRGEHGRLRSRLLELLAQAGRLIFSVTRVVFFSSRLSISRIGHFVDAL